MKSAEVHLPYYKQGDDLAYHLEHSPTVGEALEAHARQLEYAAEILRKVKSMTAGHDVHFDADTHMIQVSGPDEIIEALIDTKYASRPFDEDDEEGEDAEEGEVEEAKSGWDLLF